MEIRKEIYENKIFFSVITVIMNFMAGKFLGLYIQNGEAIELLMCIFFIFFAVICNFVIVKVLSQTLGKTHKGGND